jgi:hypothetical protein
MDTFAMTWTDPLVCHKQRKRDMRFGKWNVRSLCRLGSLTAAARELARYKLDLVGVQEVRWGKEGTVRGADCNFSMEKETKSSIWNRIFCVLQNSISSYESRVFSGRISYIVRRGCWCNVIVLNVHAPSEGKSDDSEDSFWRN